MGLHVSLPANLINSRICNNRSNTGKKEYVHYLRTDLIFAKV